MLIDPTRLSEISACVANKADQDLQSIWGGSDPKNCSVSAIFKMSVLRGYVENGTVLEEGFVASATLDLSSFSAFGDLVGNVVIDGVVVGTIPDDTYADIDALLDAYVTAIEANPIGYTAVNNGDGTITVSAPNQGSQANGFVITIQINPTFIRLSQIDYDNREWRQPIHINDQSSALFGHTVVATRTSSAPVNPFYLEDIFDHAIVQTVSVDFNAGAAGLTHRPDDDTFCRRDRGFFLPMSNSANSLSSMFDVLLKEGKRRILLLASILSVVALTALALGIILPKKYDASTLLAVEMGASVKLVEGKSPTGGPELGPITLQRARAVAPGKVKVAVRPEAWEVVPAGVGELAMPVSLVLVHVVEVVVHHHHVGHLGLLGLSCGLSRLQRTDLRPAPARRPNGRPPAGRPWRSGPRCGSPHVRRARPPRHRRPARPPARETRARLEHKVEMFGGLAWF